MTEQRNYLLGRSAVIRRIEDDAECAATSDATALITGESGVGKELVARLIHERGPRRRARMIAINCAGLPDTLLESELFGHVRGAFTGAYRDKPGLLELADRSTIFLDEVGEMSLRMQALLLRFLETGEVQRVGSDTGVRRFDVRVIAATNRNLSQRIAGGEFREDLYFRLNVIRLHVPPLRERREDITVVFDHFLALYAERHHVPVPVIAPEALARLMAYDWPGNVRELRNVAERLCLRRRDRPVSVSELPTEIAPAPARPVEQVVHASIAEALYQRIVAGGESFWAVAHEPFMSRDMTRDDLRGLIRLGLEQAHGNYRALLDLFHLPESHYNRLLSFLRKFDCQVAFQPFRVLASRQAKATLDGERPAPAAPQPPHATDAGRGLAGRVAHAILLPIASFALSGQWDALPDFLSALLRLLLAQPAEILASLSLMACFG